MEAEIGIIGGTGVTPEVENPRKVNVDTPYGSPSDMITLGDFKGRKVAILSRHGSSHSIQPSNINYRANIWALKKLGVTRIIASSAVGSLQEEVRPGEFVFVDQFIDQTRGRKSTFYDGSKVCHISVAEPFCPDLRKLLISSASQLQHHTTGTLICIEGPRFSTKAESRLFQSWNAQIIGMTLVPEVVLAREAELCYATVAMVTDYDTFKEQPVTIEEVLTTMKKNEEKVKKLIADTIPSLPQERTCSCKDALKGALL